MEPIAENQDYFSGAFGAGEMSSKFGGKVRRGGVGAKAVKTRNFKVSEKANKRRAEKYDRDLKREQERMQQEWLEEQERMFQPVDKKDRRHQEKMAKKANKRR